MKGEILGKGHLSKKPTVLVDIQRHSQLEHHEGHFRHTMIIFGKLLAKITIFLDKKP